MFNLREIGACVGAEATLTPLGHHLSILPMDVRLGKMLIYGAMFGCLEPAVSEGWRGECKWRVEVSVVSEGWRVEGRVEVKGGVKCGKWRVEWRGERDRLCLGTSFKNLIYWYWLFKYRLPVLKKTVSGLLNDFFLKKGCPFCFANQTLFNLKKNEFASV